jgi:putative CocE/NonD family hydrolase
MRTPVLVLALSLAIVPIRARQAPESIADRFTSADVMIPARDGVRLHARIFTPKDQHGPLPIIMQRTPYGVANAQTKFTAYLKALAEEGYIFVFEDIRGKFGSEGTFVMQRPARDAGDTRSLDEGTDTYDTIEWLLKNVPGNNGRVGMLGVSYDGWTTIMAAIEPHPALKAISPQASPADMFLGDDFHHNGAFRLSYGFEYAAMMETGRNVEQFTFDRPDTYDWYLALGPLATVNRNYLHEKIPTWNDFVLHPNYDAFWTRQTMVPHLREVKVPTLNVAGWWDQEDFYGPIRIYEALEPHDTRGVNHLVVGPWNHGGWSRGAGDRLGPIEFGSATAEYFRDQIQAPWFAFYLKDKGRIDLPEALTFEAGANQWRRWSAWPPKADARDRNLYFSESHTLSFDKPTSSSATAFDSYVSDPADPVPYRHRPIEPTYFPGGSRWPTWLVEDQRFVEGRPDVLSLKGAVLDQDLSIAGEVVADLFASTTGTDADWIVKLIDVYPDANPAKPELAGYELMVSNEVFRGHFQAGFDRPAPIPANKVREYRFSLHTQNYTFLKGHRLMVQVQSSWFPIIDRNPQTFVPNFFQAKAADFRKATERIYRSAAYPSHVTLPVVAREGAATPF